MDYFRCVIESLTKLGVPEYHVLAYSSTLLVSIAPFLLLFLFRVENTPQHRNYLRIALSFASGGLLGDAFIHLIPHSLGGHDHHDHSHENHDHSHEHHDHSHEHHDHGHDHHQENEHLHKHEHGHDHTAQAQVGLWIVTGIILFFLMEKFIHFIKGDSHSHSHSHNAPKGKKVKVSDDEDSSENDSPIANREKVSKKLSKKHKKASQTRLVSGLLNLIADFLHNFTDGLAIGATFAAEKSMGSITAFSILMHEIPHEIGDYAILIQAGYRHSSALWLQLVTAIGALLGTAVGLHYGTLEHATQLILPITAGGFIYIATVSVIPELLQKSSSYYHSFIEIVALLTGVAMMYWIALNE